MKLPCGCISERDKRYYCMKHTPDRPKVHRFAYWNPDANDGRGQEIQVAMTDLGLLASPGQFKTEHIMSAAVRTLLDTDEEDPEVLIRLLAKMALEKARPR